MPICTKCKKESEISNLEILDDSYICHSCLYSNHKPFEIFPIGFVESQLERGKGFGLKGNRALISKIHLFPAQSPFLYKLEDEKWITVVYYFHKPHSIRSVFSRGIDGKKSRNICLSNTRSLISRWNFKCGAYKNRKHHIIC